MGRRVIAGAVSAAAATARTTRSGLGRWPRRGKTREGEKKRSKQDSRNNSGNGNHWAQVRDARFVGPEGHPPGTDPMYNAAGYPTTLRRPQGVEPAIHGHDLRPRCFRCRMIGHVEVRCRAEITVKLAEDPNPPRNV